MTWKLTYFFAIAFPLALMAQNQSGYRVDGQGVQVGSPGSALNESGYKMLRTIPVGGEGGWDYIVVNHELNRLYVSHGTKVDILDEESGKYIDSISGTTGVHGIAFAAPFGKGYTSNGRINSLTVFDLKTNAILKKIDAGKNPDAIMYDDFTKKIFVCNGRSEDASVVDPATDAIVATIPMGGKPETAVSDGAGRMFVNIEDKNEIAVVDMKTYKVVARWKLKKGEEPAGLAIDREHKRIFSGCGNKTLSIMNYETGKLVGEYPIGSRCDGAAFDAGYVFTSNGEGTISVFREVTPDKYEALTPIASKPGARTITVDPVTHHLFLQTAEFGETPAATNENPRPRPTIKPGTFQVLEIGK